MMRTGVIMTGMVEPEFDAMLGASDRQRVATALARLRFGSANAQPGVSWLRQCSSTNGQVRPIVVVRSAATPRINGAKASATKTATAILQLRSDQVA